MANMDCKSRTSARKGKPHKNHSCKRKNKKSRKALPRASRKELPRASRESKKHKHCLRRDKSGNWHYPPDFTRQPPPNHNLLIGSMPADTLENARAVLCLIDDFFAEEPAGLAADTYFGASQVIGLVKQALYFEAHYRKSEV